MTNLLPEMRFHHPETIEEAVRLKASLEGSRFVNGGTDLLVNLRRGLGEPGDLIDLGGVNDLTSVRHVDGSLWLGAGITLDDLVHHPEVCADYPAVAYAASLVAGPTHRASATLGGNLCQDTRCVFYNQSDWWRKGNGYCLKYKGDKCHVVPKSDRCYATYHGDIAPVLMVLDAEVVIVGPNGVRRSKVADLYREDGKSYLTLETGEALAAVVLPPAAGRAAGYEKARTRDAVDFPLAGVAVSLRRDGDAIGELRIAVTGTNSAPLMVPVEGVAGTPWDDAAATKVALALRKIANPLRTTIVSSKYRRRVLLAISRRLIDTLWAGGQTA